MHIKVGDPSWDTSRLESEVSAVEEKVVELLDENDVNCLVFVTHCFVDVSVVEG